MAGSVQRQKVYVQVTAWCLVAKAVRATSIHAGKPREARRIAPRFTSHTPDDPLDKAAYLLRFVPLSSRTPAAKDAAGERFFHGCRQNVATQPNLAGVSRLF